MLQNGIYTAVGTPSNNSGHIIPSSLEKQIHDQINAGVAGILLFGSMGISGCITDKEFVRGIETAVKVVNGKCALLVGASENSISRASEKINILNNYKIDGIVLTPPYYMPTDETALVNFFRRTAAMTKKNYYLYDNQAITKQKITFGIIEKLFELKNLKGIKSGDLALIKKIDEHIEDKDFTPIYSDFEMFDVAYAWGITRFLDGIFACMPKSANIVMKSIKAGNISLAKDHYNKMLETRSLMISIGIWPAFTHAMNLLGYQGNFSPDYVCGIGEEDKERIKEVMTKLGEI